MRVRRCSSFSSGRREEDDGLKSYGWCQRVAGGGTARTSDERGPKKQGTVVCRDPWGPENTRSEAKGKKKSKAFETIDGQFVGQNSGFVNGGICFRHGSARQTYGRLGWYVGRVTGRADWRGSREDFTLSTSPKLVARKKTKKKPAEHYLLDRCWAE